MKMRCPKMSCARRKTKTCPDAKPHDQTEICGVAAAGCPKCVPVRAKRKASGLPTSQGFWEWFPLPDHEAKFVLKVTACNDWEVGPLDWHVWCQMPVEGSPLGMGHLGTGRTVRTMGGHWGRRVAE